MREKRTTVQRWTRMQSLSNGVIEQPLGEFEIVTAQCNASEYLWMGRFWTNNQPKSVNDSFPIHPNSNPNPQASITKTAKYKKIIVPHRHHYNGIKEWVIAPNSFNTFSTFLFFSFHSFAFFHDSFEEWSWNYSGGRGEKLRNRKDNLISSMTTNHTMSSLHVHVTRDRASWLDSSPRILLLASPHVFQTQGVHECISITSPPTIIIHRPS